MTKRGGPGPGPESWPSAGFWWCVGLPSASEEESSGSWPGLCKPLVVTVSRSMSSCSRALNSCSLLVSSLYSCQQRKHSSYLDLLLKWCYTTMWNNFMGKNEQSMKVVHIQVVWSLTAIYMDGGCWKPANWALRASMFSLVRRMTLWIFLSWNGK